MPAAHLPTLTPHRIKEILPAEVLTKMHVPAKPAYPVFKPEHLANYNMFIFSIPT